jgi:hypothetical protein
LRKCDSGLGLGSGLAWEQESNERNASTGLRHSTGDRGKADDGETRLQCSGEQSCAREEGKQRGKGLVRILTATRGGGGRRKEASGLGRAGREREREEESRPAGLGPQERKERGKIKERVGQAQLEKEGEKELHSNVFEFKFEI